MTLSDHPPPAAAKTLLDEILRTADLALRPSRAPAHDLESKTLVALARDLARFPDVFFDHLAHAALALCNAGSAGISVASRTPDGAEVFHWAAAAGEFFPFTNATLPRHFSPCGIVLDRNSPQLMSDPARFFPYIADISPQVAEVLLVPFHHHDVPVGTIWVVAHDHHRFDNEDVRLLTSLSYFASAAHTLEQSRPR